MKAGAVASGVLAGMIAGYPLLSSAAEHVLNDPACLKSLTPEERWDLNRCVERGPRCAKYWPNQPADLLSCRASTAWVRAAMAWPQVIRDEVFGTEQTSTAASGTASSSSEPAAPSGPAPGAAGTEPAWKKLPRSGNTASATRFDVTKSGSTNPYATTSTAITPEAAKKAGWDIGVITDTLKAGGQLVQDRSARADPESAAAAKKVLEGMKLGEYAASDEAIEAGRRVAVPGGPAAPGAGPSPESDRSFIKYYEKYSRTAQLPCSPDVSARFRERWSRFTDPTLARFYRMAITPGQIKTHAEEWAPKIKQYSLQAQQNELGRGYYMALESARKACQITSACSDGDAEYERFPMALNSNITVEGTVGRETGALVALQTSYALQQINVEFNDEYGHYIHKCM